MKRTDPATDLAERAIRQWQMSGSQIARHDLAKETEVIPSSVRAGGGISTFTVGSVAGFLGAITCLICNIAGALVLGVEPLHLLRIYATILEGRRALDISRDDFFIAAFALHIVTGILFGTIFALGAVSLRRTPMPLFGGRRLWDCHLVGELLRHTVVASASAARKCIHPHGNSNRRCCPDSRQLRGDGGTCNVCAAAGFYVSLSNKRTNEGIISRRSPSQMSVEVGDGVWPRKAAKHGDRHVYVESFGTELRFQ